MSQRNSAELILDAVRDCVVDLGVRRTTFAEVARRAGVSRMTMYRHFPDVGACVAALMAREFGALLIDAEKAASDLDSGRRRLVEATVRIAEQLPSHPLFARVIDVDPEMLLPYVIDRLGSTQRAGVALFERWLAEGQADGSVRLGDVGDLAYCLQLVVQGFVLSARITARERDTDAVLAELRLLLDSYLAPGDR